LVRKPEGKEMLWRLCSRRKYNIKDLKTNRMCVDWFQGKGPVASSCAHGNGS